MTDSLADTQNRQMMIASLPDGQLTADNFELTTAPVPVPGDGEVLARTMALTIGAGQRAGLQGSASYAGAPTAGRVMNGTGVARVVSSNAAGFAEGDVVRGATNWQDYACAPANHWQKVDAGSDAALHLGVLGTNGLTAFFGLTDIGAPQPGETVVVSAAAGSVGHIVGQIAKVKGARVVGIAGSDAKCQVLVNDLGFDVAINRRDDDFRDQFKAATPDRIDVYFDNTGGEVLGSALFRMNTHGRIVCCGVVSQYDTASPGAGPRGVPGLLVNNRVRMQGFLVFDYAERYEAGRAEMQGWIDSGQLVPKVSEFDGLESAGQAFVELLAGGTVGTTIVRVSN